MLNASPTEVAKTEAEKRKLLTDKTEAIVKKQEDTWKKEHGDGYLSGVGLGMKYAASKVLSGSSNIVPAMVYLSDRVNKVLTGQPLLSDEEKNELIDNTVEASRLGLNEDYQGSSKAMGAIGGLLEFIPAALAAEGTGGASFYINGIGNAYKEVQNAKKNGAKFENGAEDLYIQGKGVIDYVLMTRLNAHSMFPTLPSTLRNVASREASLDAIKGLVKSGQPLTAEGITVAFKDAAVTMAENIKSKGVPFLKDLAKGYAKTAGDLSALTVADVSLKKLTNQISGNEDFEVANGSAGENIAHILSTDAPVFALLGARNNVGVLFDKSPYRNEVIEVLKKDSTPESVERLKEAVMQQAQEREWSVDDVEGTMSRIDQLATAVTKLPKTLSPAKYDQALDVILGKQNLTEQMARVKEVNKSLDPALAEVGTPEERALTAKLEQSDDKLREVATGKKMKYLYDDEKNEYFKQLGGDGKPESITKERFELEEIEREAKEIAKNEPKYEETETTEKESRGEEDTTITGDTSSIEGNRKGAEQSSSSEATQETLIADRNAKIYQEILNDPASSSSQKKRAQDYLNDPKSFHEENIAKYDNHLANETDPEKVMMWESFKEDHEESLAELNAKADKDINIKNESINSPESDIALIPKPKFTIKGTEVKPKIETNENQQPISEKENVVTEEVLPKRNEEVGSRAGDKLRTFSNKVREGKINKLGGFKSSTGFDGAWDIGLEGVATAIDGGAKIADAIETGLKAIQETDWYKGLKERETFDQKYRDHMTSEYEAEVDFDSSAPQGISKEQTRKQREYRGEEDLDPREKQTLQGMFDAGKKAVDEGLIDPRALATEVSRKPRNISPQEVNALLYDRQRIKNEIENIYDFVDQAILNGKSDQLEQLTKRQLYLEEQRAMNEEAVRAGANQNALAQVSMRSMITKDYSRSEQEARMRTKNGGELTDEMRAEIKRYSDQLEEANAKLKALEDSRAEAAIKRELLKQQREHRVNKKAVDKESLKKERKIIVNDFLTKLREIRGTTSSVAVPYARELAASVPFMKKMLVNLTKEGVVEFKDVIQRIHEEFQSHIEDLTERDVIDVLAGKYNEPRATKSQLMEQRNAITRLAKLTAKLEDLQAGLQTIKNPAKARTTRNDILELEKQVRELEKSLGYDVTERNKANLRSQIDRINKRIADGDFEKADSRPKPDLDDETITLKARVKKAQNNFDAMAERLDRKNQSKFNRALDTYSDINRMFLLSGVKTLGKLYSFAAERAISTPIEEMLNTINSKLPFLRNIAERSPRFAGGLNIRAEAKAITAKVSKASWKDTYEVLKSGASELDVLYGKAGVDRDFQLNPSALEFFGRLHGAFKNSTKRAEFFRSYEKRLEYAARNGKDINDPNVQFSTALEAYSDGKRAILMHDNKLTDAYKHFLRTMEMKGDWEGKTIATFFRTLLPIIKIPTNYALEAFDTATFGARALPYLFKAAIKGSESLTPTQANTVMRSLAKGQFGAAMMTIAYFNPQVFGGYYSGKRDDKDLKAGEVIIHGMHLPHFMTHHPILEAMQIAATMRRAIDSANGNGDSKGIIETLTSKNRDAIEELAVSKVDPKLKEAQSVSISYNDKNYEVYVKDGKMTKVVMENGFRTGFKTAVSGLSEQVPFFETPGQISAGLKSDNKLNKFEGDFIRNRIEPRLLQETADWSDKDTDVKFREHPFQYMNSDVTKRDPRTILEHLKIGVPFLRQQVDKKVQGSTKLTQITVDTDVYLLTADQVKEREKYITEFIDEFAVDITESMKEAGKTDKDIELYINTKALNYSKSMMLESHQSPDGEKINLKIKNQ